MVRGNEDPACQQRAFFPVDCRGGGVFFGGFGQVVVASRVECAAGQG